MAKELLEAEVLHHHWRKSWTYTDLCTLVERIRKWRWRAVSSNGAPSPGVPSRRRSNQDAVIAGTIATVLGGMVVLGITQCSTKGPSPTAGALVSPSSDSRTMIPSPSELSGSPVIRPTPTSTGVASETAVPAETQYLDTFQYVDGSVGTAVKEISGNVYGHSLYKALTNCGSTYSVKYDLARKYTLFHASVGLSDRDTHGTPVVTFLVAADKSSYRFTVNGPGQVRDVAVDITGSLYLTLTVMQGPLPGANCTVGAYVDTNAVWGDAQVK